jgi:hypothetical protein
MLPALLFAAATAVQIPAGAALTDAITARDATLFHLFFQECAPARLAALVTPDFEMYHDRGGKVAGSGQAFVDLYTKQCTDRAKPGAWRSRRELIAGTLDVEPVPGFGAIEEGDHVFYERQGDGPERLAGKAHFVHLWQLGEDGSWRMARVLSYRHEAASNPEAH